MIFLVHVFVQFHDFAVKFGSPFPDFFIPATTTSLLYRCSKISLFQPQPISLFKGIQGLLPPIQHSLNLDPGLGLGPDHGQDQGAGPGLDQVLGAAGGMMLEILGIHFM